MDSLDREIGEIKGFYFDDQHWTILLTMVAVSGCPSAHGTPVERMKPGVLAAEVGKDEKPSHPPERLYGTWTATDVDTKMGGSHDKRCMMEARLEGLQPIAVSDEAESIGQAIAGAAEKLKRSLDHTLGRLSGR